MTNLKSLDKETRAILNDHGFETIPFGQLATKLKQRGLDPQANRLKSDIKLPPPETITELPEVNTAQYERLAMIGRAAINAGQVGVVVLNGGMATRFGGVPKGAATAFAGRSFLDFKLSQVAKVSGGRAPVILMNSFATEQATQGHLTTLKTNCPVRAFSQMVSLRLTPQGEIYQDANGKPSLHAPGHGDFPYAINRSGELARFIEEGGKWLTLSNVDNLGASLDPVVIGAHIDGAKPMTVELVATNTGDVGGFPALVDGNMTIVEAFRIPASFDVSTIPVFNTNTFVFDVDTIAGDIELEWFAVEKKADAQTVIQFERLVGQMTDFVDVTWLKVPRDGEFSRFVPIKVPEDLELKADDLQQILKRQGVL